MLKVFEAMRVHAVRVSPDAAMGEALDIMDLYQAPVLPVVDADDTLVGVLSEPDVTTRLLCGIASDDQAAAAGAAAAWRALTVRDVMSAPPLCVQEQETLAVAARLLSGSTLAQLPVTRDGKLTGLLGRPDICQAFLETLHTD